MKIELTGTVQDGTLNLDQSVPLPNGSRVTVMVETASESAAEEPTIEERQAAWDSFLERIKERPVRSGGQHFTRDELHERR